MGRWRRSLALGGVSVKGEPWMFPAVLVAFVIAMAIVAWVTWKMGKGK